MSATAAIYHLCVRSAFEAARAAGVYAPDSLVQEGFVHLSRAHQVLPTARAYFAGVADVVVLVVDPARLTAPLRHEAPAPLPTATPKPAADAGDTYPHCYGPIPLDAVVDVLDLAHFAATVAATVAATGTTGTTRPA